MDELEERMIYDTIISIQNHAGRLCDVVNKHGDDEDKAAYKDGVYAPVMRLSLLLGPEAMDRGKERHAQVRKRLDDWIAERKANKQWPYDKALAEEAKDD